MDYEIKEEMFDEWDDEEEVATLEEMKAEAIKRMRKMHIIGDAIRQFEKEDIVMVSEPPIGGLYWLNDEEQEEKKAVEKKCGGLVYLVVRAFTTIGNMDSYLYVSKYKNEWEYDNYDIDDGIVMTYTINHDMPDCSEFGCIGFQSAGGGVLRKF